MRQTEAQATDNTYSSGLKNEVIVSWLSALLTVINI